MTRTCAVVTTFNRKGWKKYGAKMVQSFEENWPRNIHMYIYTEDFEPVIDSDRIHNINLLETNPELVNFLGRWGKDKYKNGYEDKLQREGFKFNSVRFSYKTFAVIHAGLNIDVDIVIWLDADTFTFNKIPANFIEGLLPDESKYYCAYLGRGDKKYPECGFVMYNTRHPQHANFLNEWRNLYVTDELFKMDEWHDSYVFDEIRKKYVREGKFLSHDLSPTHKGEGHPFIASVLGGYIDHLKGEIRKELGSSWGVDIKNSHNGNTYWDQIRKDRTRRNKATSKMLIKTRRAEKG
jgi:hypothetical protein